MDIEELARKLELWRKNKKSFKERIPQEFWEQAAILAGETSAVTVASKLRLNRGDLLGKMGLRPKPKVPAKKKLKFTELKALPMGETPIFELTTKSGISLKVYQ